MLPSPFNLFPGQFQLMRQATRVLSFLDPCQHRVLRSFLILSFPALNGSPTHTQALRYRTRCVVLMQPQQSLGTSNAASLRIASRDLA